ncbi:MAG TPA: penicillin-binding protein 2 [Aliidongia sp.]|uniref:penicillin-binding protein 2 n=1 Tax=Aliidongia sp. TaxID=1914230 RepID=UPI002DDD65B8|nr:penicillin-binding protein 2 [Aliidongia sp.]HEV2675164.1 penicillin-binding protein 2 [Aliidongia sp.]
MKTRPLAQDKSRYKVLTRRTLMLGGIQAGLVGTLAARMYYLQVLQADKYKVLAEENRINVRLLAPQRGRILDRFGVPLAVNQQSYRVVIVAEQAGDIDSTLNAIGTLIPLGDNERHRVLREMKRKHSFVPIMVRENLSWEEVARIEVNIPELPGVQIEVGRNRYYPFGDRVTDITGYVAPVAEKELTGEAVMELPDFRIGKAGIEKAQDLELRGTAGTSQIEVNAFGRIVREISRDDGRPGEEIATTIDMALQDFTMRRLRSEESATCVVIDVVTGEILTMASSPSYDANTFTQGLTNAVWGALNTDPHTPLNNKAIQGVYPPGSTFKPVVAMAALESGMITADFRVNCPGVFTLGDHDYHCWQHRGHGTLDLHGGLKNSCDVYFYEVAMKIGVDRVAAMANRLGMGELTGIDIPNERPGIIPTRAWKLARFGQRWVDGDTPSIAIGQGYIAGTPLQLATMLSRIISNRVIVPRLVRAAGVMEPGKPFDPDLGAKEFATLDFNPAHIAAILSGMNAVTNEQGGTAYAARITDPGMEMGGKSGTAQVKQITAAERERGIKKPEQQPWKDRDHAIFIAFAPVGNPRYACAVVVEHGIGGGKYAGPIARDVLRECQRRDPSRRVPPDPMIVAAAEPSVGAPGSPTPPPEKTP